MISKHYLLEGILDQKEKYTFENGVELYLCPEYENNLRKRNPQLGIVRCIPQDNPMKLELGETIVVNHYCFYGDVADNKGYTVQPHIKHEGKMLFPIQPRDMYFKYKDGKPEPLDGIVICETFDSPSEHNGLELIPFTYKDRAKVISGSVMVPTGSTVLVKPNALYEIEIDKIKYYRLREEDCVALLGDDIALLNGFMIIEDLPDEYKTDIDLLGAKLNNTVKSKIIKSSVEGYNEGDTVIGWRNTGVKYEDYRFVNLRDDQIAGKWKSI